MEKSQKGNGAPKLTGVSAILASICCIGPLVLLALGYLGARTGYRPVFIGVVLVAIFFAYRGVFRSAQACDPESGCAAPRGKTAYKVIFWVGAAAVLGALVYPYVVPLFH
ncbi:MAG TPA: mercuric transporter MerT family protein [Luteimonas sp.]|nr:mercuric transporter MerT family protein [Luteimonas sp.]